jgi:hypothetical protein
MMGEEFPAVLAAAQDGGEDAFAALWRDGNPALLRYLRVTAQDAAEDVAAETWVPSAQFRRRLPALSPGLNGVTGLAALSGTMKTLRSCCLVARRECPGRPGWCNASISQRLRAVPASAVRCRRASSVVANTCSRWCRPVIRSIFATSGWGAMRP